MKERTWGRRPVIKFLFPTLAAEAFGVTASSAPPPSQEQPAPSEFPPPSHLSEMQAMLSRLTTYIETGEKNEASLMHMQLLDLARRFLARKEAVSILHEANQSMARGMIERFLVVTPAKRWEAAVIAGMSQPNLGNITCAWVDQDHATGGKISFSYTGEPTIGISTYIAKRLDAGELEKWDGGDRSLSVARSMPLSLPDLSVVVDTLEQSHPYTAGNTMTGIYFTESRGAKKISSTDPFPSLKPTPTPSPQRRRD